MAVEEFRYAAESGFPFRPFESVMKYNVTYNTADILSLYYDVYEYTGGAHGITKRFGDTWRSLTGWFLELSDFSPRGTNYKHLLLENVVETATKQIAEGTHSYFDNYKSFCASISVPQNFTYGPAALRFLRSIMPSRPDTKARQYLNITPKLHLTPDLRSFR